MKPLLRLLGALLLVVLVLWMLTPVTKPRPYQQCLQLWPEYWSRTCGHGRTA